MSEAGLRRGSLMTGIPLSEWASMRRASMRMEDQTDDILFDDGNTEKTLAWTRKESFSERFKNFQEGLDIKMNKYKSHNSHQCSVLQNELTNDCNHLIRRASIRKAHDESVNKGISLLQRSSRYEDLTESDEQGSEEVLKNKTTRRGVMLPKELDVTLGISSMPEDILGEIPCRKSQRIVRRCSALPELQSLREMVATEVFQPNRSLIIPGHTPSLQTQDCFKEETKLNMKRLYQRRGSG